MVTESLADARSRSLEALCRILRCPECRQGMLVSRSDELLCCEACQQRYPVIEGVPFLFEAKVLDDYVAADRSTERPLPAWPTRVRGGAYHWREYRIEELLPPVEEARRVLLLGCGDSGERPYLNERGFEVVAFDIKRTSGTDFVADAHLLPLQDASFDVVISMQVLEHLHSPWIAVGEIARVLRPGGWFVGSVAFLKPYHKSYFHMTHMGVMRLLDEAGLRTDRVAGAQSLAYTLYGGMVPLGSRPVRRALLGAFDRALHGVRAGAWTLRRRISADQRTDRFRVGLPLSFREYDHLVRAPAIVFRAQKNV